MEGLVRSFMECSRSRMWSACGKFLDWLASSWNFKYHQPSFNQSKVYGLVVSQFSSGVGVGWWYASYRNSLGMCQAIIYLSGNWKLGGSVMWQNYSLNYYQFFNLKPLFVSTSSCFPVINSRSAFYFRKQGHRACSIRSLYTVSIGNNKELTFDSATD